MDTITNSYYYSQLPTTKIKTISIPKCVYRNVEAYRCNSYSYNQNNYSVKPSEIQSYSRQQSKLQTVFYHDFLATDAIPIDLLEATVKSDIIDNYEQLIKYSKRSLSLVSIDNSSTYSNSVGNSYSNSNDNTRVIHSVGNQLDHLRIDTLTSLITSNCDINYYNILNQTRYNNYPVDNSPTSYTINITNGAPIQQLLEVGHNYNSNTNILVATKKELYYVQAIDVRDSVIDRTEDDLKDSFRNRRTDKEIEKRKVLWKNKKLYPDSYNILDPLQKFLLPFDLVGVSNYYNSSYSIANCFCSNGNLYEWSPNSGVQLISSGSKFQDIQNNNNELIKNYLTYPKYMHLESTKHPCLTVVAINNNIYINDRRDNNINAPIRRNDTQFHCISQHPNDDNTIISCYNDKIVLIDKRLASRNISERFVPSSHDNISFVGNYNSNCGDSADIAIGSSKNGDQILLHIFEESNSPSSFDMFKLVDTGNISKSCRYNWETSGFPVVDYPTEIRKASLSGVLIVPVDKSIKTSDVVDTSYNIDNISDSDSSRDHNSDNRADVTIDNIITLNCNNILLQQSFNGDLHVQLIDIGRLTTDFVANIDRKKKGRDSCSFTNLSPLQVNAPIGTRSMQEPSFKQIDVKTRRRTRSKEKHKIESELFPTEYPIPSTAIIPTQSELELKNFDILTLDLAMLRGKWPYNLFRRKRRDYDGPIMPTIDINKEYKKFEREFMEIENNLLVNYPMTLWEIALHLDKKSDDKVILKELRHYLQNKTNTKESLLEINLEDYQQIEECYTVNSFLSKTNYYHNVNNVTTKQPTLYYLNRKVGNNINKNAKLSIDQRELHSYDKHIYYDIHEQRNLKWYEKYSIITDDNDPNKDLKNYYKQLEEPCCCKLFFINRKKLISESSGNFGSDSDNSSHDDDDGDINTYSDSNSSSKSESSRERRQKNQKSNKDDSQEQGGDHKISREGGDLSNLQNKTKILENDINKFVKDNNSRKCDYIVSIDNYNCPCNSIFCLLPHLLRYQINDQVLPTFGEKAITTKRKQRTETVESTTKSVTKTEEEITAEMFATLDELWKDEKLSSERKINNHIFDTYKQIN